MNTIGSRIRQAREAAGLTQAELGKRCNTTKQTIFKYENGIVTNIPMDRVSIIAQALGIEPAHLMGWKSDLETASTLTQLGQRITAARVFREYTVEDLASAVGLNKHAILEYESGEVDLPRLSDIEAIGAKLRTNPAWLVGISSDKTYTDSSSGTVVYEPCNLFAPLKRMRNDLQWSVEDVAYAIGISTDDYRAIESGHNTDCITLAKIAQYFCCSTDYVLAVDGGFCEDEHIKFCKGNLLPLHNYFQQLSPGEQDQVMLFVKSLAEGHQDHNIIRIAARNGNYSEIMLSDNQLKFLKSTLDQMPDATEDL